MGILVYSLLWVMQDLSHQPQLPSRHGKGLGRTASRLKVLSKLERLLEAFDSTTIQGLRFEQTAMQVVYDRKCLAPFRDPGFYASSEHTLWTG